MYNIRIKQLPKTGEQRNYSLVDRNDLYIKVNPLNSDTNVKNTISAVPREQATIEAEGGETVVGDINGDGYLEHNTIVGKKHTQGGVPLDIAPGSFIFSDTKKLKITDPEILKLFGVGPVKGGVTPATIAKKYQTNNYMNVLKSDDTDEISKRTASKMLENNLEKLGMLALVQESMKGFPDGVPAIAESVMAGLQGQQMPGQEQGEGVAHELMEGQEEEGEQEEYEMRYGGGLYKAQYGVQTPEYVGTDFQGRRQTRADVDRMMALQRQQWATGNPESVQSITPRQVTNNVEQDTINTEPIELENVFVPNNNRKYSNKVTENGNPIPGFKFWNGITPVTVTKVHSDFGQDNPESPYIELSNGEKLTKKAFQQLLTKGSYNDIHGGIGDAYTINQNIEKRRIKDSSGTEINGFDIYSGDKLNFKGNDYTVVNPNADMSRGYYNTWKPLRDTFDNTQGIVQVYNNKTKKYEFLEAEDLGDAYRFDKSQIPVSPNEQFRNIYNTNLNKTRRITNPGYSTVQSAYAPVPTNSVYTPQGRTVPQGRVVDTTTTPQDRLPQEDNAGLPEIPQTTVTPQARQQPPQQVTTPRANTPRKNVQQPVQQVEDEIQTTRTNEVFEYGGNLQYAQVGTEVKKKIVKKETSDITGNTRVTYSDGSTEIIPGEVSYDTADEELRKQVSEKYNITDLKPEYRFKNKTVGPQTQKSGYKVDPESGFLYNEAAGAPRPGAGGLQNYMEIHKEAVDSYPGGAEKWKQDMINAKGKENPAMTHLLNYENTAVGTRADGKQYVDLTKRGALVPGVENFNLPGISKKPVTPTPGKKQAFTCVNGVVSTIEYGDGETIPSGAYASRAEAEAACIPNKQITIPPPVQKRRPWWIQDQVAFAADMTDSVTKYDPALQRVEAEIPDYVLKDPAARLAALKEQESRRQEGLFSSTAGNVAGASMVGPGDRELAASRDIIGDIENQNVDIVNQALPRNAQIINQANLLKGQALQKYIAESATANQQYDNARRALKNRQVGSWMNGTTNWMAHKQMEDVLYPNVMIDSITGDVTQTPGNRQMFDEYGRPVYDPYVNPSGKSGKSGSSYEDRLNYYMSKGRTFEQAHDAANAEINGASTRTASTDQTKKNQPIITPMIPNYRQVKYGGYIKKYGGVVNDYGALPLYFFED